MELTPHSPRASFSEQFLTRSERWKRQESSGSIYVYRPTIPSEWITVPAATILDGTCHGTCFKRYARHRGLTTLDLRSAVPVRARFTPYLGPLSIAVIVL